MEPQNYKELDLLLEQDPTEETAVAVASIQEEKENEWTGNSSPDPTSIKRKPRRRVNRMAAGGKENLSQKWRDENIEDWQTINGIHYEDEDGRKAKFPGCKCIFPTARWRRHKACCKHLAMKNI